MRISAKPSTFGRHRTTVFRALLIGLCLSSVTMARAEYSVSTEVDFFNPPQGWTITGTTSTDTASASAHYYNNLATAGASFARPQTVPPGGPSPTANAEVTVTVTWKWIGGEPPNGKYHSHTHVNATLFYGTSIDAGPSSILGLGLARAPEVQRVTIGHTPYWSQDKDSVPDLETDLGMGGTGTVYARATAQVGLNPVKLSGYAEGKWWMTTGAAN